ncbi:hypothetical protein EV426DRAFT_83672 [Tirmania nivea]|nr:hypothetical protein EV426DRAFT_83672 [Tirmania nivea]
MFDNAKIYNEPDSQIYKDANTLQKMVQEFEGREPSKSVAPANARTAQKHSNTATDGGVGLRMEDTMMKIIDGLLSSVDKNGDTIFDDFRNLVSRKDYPEYYKIIKEPMSLNTVRKRILAHRYTSWSEFERDMELIVQNAKTFNEEDSFIVQVALELQKRFEATLLKERGPVEKSAAPTQSGIRLKLNMKSENQAPSTPAPKLKLTIRNPRGSPEPAQQPVSQAPEIVHGNGYTSQPNGHPNRRTPVQHPAPVARQQNSQPSYQQSPIPTPPIIDTPAEVKTEPNGVSTRPRRSPAGTPKPAKVLPVRKSRTPALLSEAETITVAPRASGSHLSPPAQDLPRQTSATPVAENMGPPANHMPTPGSNAMSPAAQPQALNGNFPLANGIDPRFRQPGKGIEDALISNLTVGTHPNLNITPAIEYSFPADATKSFQNHVVFFEAQHYILVVSLALGPTMQGRPYTASITVNGHRLFFNTLQPNPNRRKEDQMTMACDVRLIPGKVTHIEVLLIAGQKGQKAGMGEQEQEKFVVDAFLHYE